MKYVFQKGIKIPGTFLTPIATSSKIRSGKPSFALALRCDCGNFVVQEPAVLASGRVKSCGCKNAELNSIRSTTHGLSKTPEYFAAFNAIRRCSNKKDRSFKHYGGRGIKVEFENAIDMARWLVDHLPKPSPESVLDRIDNNGNYSRKNLRWTTQKESSRNNRNSRLITINGKTKRLCVWAEESGIGAMTIHGRIQNNVPEDLWLWNGKLTSKVRYEHLYGESRENVRLNHEMANATEEE